MSAVGRKAAGDLARHKVRAVLTVLTLTLALSSLAIAAIPGLMDGVMVQQVKAARLYDIAVTTRDLALSRAQLHALGHLRNVAAFAASVELPAQVTADGQRQDATIWGLDFASQPVDAVQLLTGTAPASPGQLLADAGNNAVTGMTTSAGDRVAVRTATGAQAYLRVNGTAHGLATSPSANSGGGPVFYGSEATVRSLARMRGVNHLAFRLHDNTPATETAAIAAIRGYLKSQTGAEPFVTLPVTRAAGDWPDRGGFRQIVSILYVITVLALLSALFLIFSTMNTLVVEQSAEIAILKSLGGRRAQIAGIVLRAAGLLGAIGAVLGTGLGIVLAYLLTSYFASSLYDLKAGFAISVPVVVASLGLSPALTVVASLPGLRRAQRRPIAQTLAGRGAPGFGAGRLERLAGRSQLLPGTARMGMRNILRNKRRSAATVAQIAVATGLAIALFAGGQSVAAFVSTGYGNFRYTIEVNAMYGSALGKRAEAVAAATPGVTRVEPLVEGQVTYRGTSFASWGLTARPLYAYRLSAGRWFVGADSHAHVPPVVLGPAAARTAGAHVGQVLTLGTPAGPRRFRVIGIDTGEVNAGADIYFPLAVLQHLNSMASNVLWLTTASTQPASVDRVSTAVRDRLAAAGYPVTSQSLSAQEAGNQSQTSAIIVLIDVLGLLVVAITLIGLVNALTMSVIERTREVGVLRCLGARTRQVRRVFGAEAIMLAAAGWALGVPLAILIARLVLLFISHDINVPVPVVFPLLSAPAGLGVTTAITLLAIRPPLRRATRIQPVVALRYE